MNISGKMSILFYYLDEVKQLLHTKHLASDQNPNLYEKSNKQCLSIEIVVVKKMKFLFN